jgi:hypothetical protein
MPILDLIRLRNQIRDIAIFSHELIVRRLPEILIDEDFHYRILLSDHHCIGNCAYRISSELLASEATNELTDSNDIAIFLK